MSENLILEYDAFLRSIKRNKDIAHSVLIGAGASISSGIQSAYDCIWEWKKDIYLSQNPNSSDYYKNTKNESVKISIQDWLDNEGIYPAQDSDEEYSFYAEKAYPIADDRRKYFQSLIEGKEPYIGYKLLCILNEQEIVKAIWTTNFDGFVVRAAHQENLTPIEINLDNSDRIFRNQSRKELLTIALHGDYKYSTLKNTSSELDTQNEIFTDVFSRYHNDKNLIVIGYSGRDQSLMKSLSKTFSKRGSGRLYWCGYGHDIGTAIKDLIVKARASGREAYFIPTDGFDKTLLHLTKACFEDDNQIISRVDRVLKHSGANEIETVPFSLNIDRTDKYIKSNLHPISFPKEVFQFDFDFQNERPYRTLKELTKGQDICAVPFKRNVFALATQSSINKVFGSKIKNGIVRTPISKYDIEKVTAFKSLMLQAVLKLLSDNELIESNFKNKLWFKNIDTTISHNQQSFEIHKALYVSLFFDFHEKYAFLSFKPTIHLISESLISREIKQSIGKSSLEKLFNKQYDELLENWNQILFKGKRIASEYPKESGTGFEFSISQYSAFAEIKVRDKSFKAYHPKQYDINPVNKYS